MIKQVAEMDTLGIFCDPRVPLRLKGNVLLDVDRLALLYGLEREHLENIILRRWVL